MKPPTPKLHRVPILAWRECAGMCLWVCAAMGWSHSAQNIGQNEALDELQAQQHNNG